MLYYLTGQHSTSNILLSLVDVHYLQSSFFMMVPIIREIWAVGLVAGAIWAHSCVTPPVFWPWRGGGMLTMIRQLVSPAEHVFSSQPRLQRGPTSVQLQGTRCPCCPSRHHLPPRPGSHAIDTTSQHYYIATTSPGAFYKEKVLVGAFSK